MRDIPTCHMKAITVRQPFAWLLVNGIKDTENRTWRTHYRGPLLIHAAASVPSPEEMLTILARHPGVHIPLPTGLRDFGELVFGAIVGVVTLTGCDKALAFGQPECGPWAEYPEPLRRLGHPFWWWRVACAHTLREPVPMKGRLGLWDVTDQDVIDEAGHLVMGDEEWIHA